MQFPFPVIGLAYVLGTCAIDLTVDFCGHLPTACLYYSAILGAKPPVSLLVPLGAAMGLLPVIAGVVRKASDKWNTLTLALGLVNIFVLGTFLVPSVSLVKAAVDSYPTLIQAAKAEAVVAALGRITMVHIFMFITHPILILFQYLHLNEKKELKSNKSE